MVVPLFVVVIMAVLLFRGPKARYLLTYSALVWTSQLPWYVAQGREIDIIQMSVWCVQAAAMISGIMTARIVAREAQRNANRLLDLFNGVPVGLYQTTADGTSTVVNPYLAERLGEPETVTAEAPSVSSDEQAAEPALMKSTNPDRPVERRLVRNDGRVVWVRERGRIIDQPANQIVRYEGVIEDITARKLAEAEAREAEERFQRAFSDAPIGMALAHLDGRFFQVNRAMCELLGFTEDQLLTMGWRDITPPDDQARNVEAVQALRHQNGGSITIDRQYRNAGGDMVRGKVGLSLVAEDGERGAYIIAQVVDLSAQARLQENLENLLEAKDEFVASVSHELRTPLTAVVGLAAELRDNFASIEPDERRELIGHIAEQSSGVAQIVDDLLVMARSNIGQLSISPSDIDVWHQVQAAVSECRHLGSNKEVVVSGGLERAWADPQRFRQIVRNLLINAMRYGGDRIRVDVNNGRQTTHIRIIDNGPGIPPADRQSIFDPYERARNTNQAPGSMGLGLTVSRTLARIMDGDLVYHRQGHESIFELTLPGKAQ
jgi:PAS domain S-box-containing protein